MKTKNIININGMIYGERIGTINQKKDANQRSKKQKEIYSKIKTQKL